MNWLKKNWQGVALADGAILLAFIVLAAASPIRPGVAFKTDIWGAATSVVTGLLVTALLVERSLTVVNALLFGDQQRDAELKLMGLQGNVSVTAAAGAIAAVHKAKERLRLLLGFAAGLFVSLAGVRTLQDLMVTTTSATVGGQTVTTPLPIPPWFDEVDVLLTAGLIAGGSNGLAYLLQILKDRVAPGSGNGSNANPHGGNGGGARAVAAAAAKPPALTVSPAELRARMMTTG